MEPRRNDITEYIPGLRRYAMSLVRNPADADELVQESLCRAIEKMRPWRRVRNTRAYLFTILHNLYIDRVVKSARKNEQVLEETVDRNLVVAPSQFYRVELQELYVALQNLPDEHRAVVLLVGLEGMTYHATADVLGIPVGTVMSRLSRARETLRRMTDRPQKAHGNRTSETASGRARNEKIHSHTERAYAGS